MSKKGRRLLEIALSLILMHLIIVSCNSQPKEVDLIFQSIEQGELGHPNYYEAMGPGLKIVSQPEEVKNLEGLITGSAQQALLELDYSKYFVLAAFHGRRGSGGYGIQVDRVSRSDNTVKVNVELEEPKPQSVVADAETSPYHLIIVQKNGIWIQEIQFNLIADSTVLTSVSHDIP